jgi:hypothetical protein
MVHDRKSKRGQSRQPREPRDFIARALKSIQRALVEDLAELNQSLPSSIDLQLSLSPGSESDWLERADGLLKGMAQSVADAQPDTGEGSVWCFQCKGRDCVHVMPENQRTVFVGYSATGKPRWMTFLDVCLKIRPSGMDGLFQDRATVVAITFSDRDLHEERLPEFIGDPENAGVLGQVIVGFLQSSLKGSASDTDKRALTVQILGRSDVPTQVRYSMNILGFNLSEIHAAAAEQGPREPAERIRRVLARLASRLAAAEQNLATLEGTPTERRREFIRRTLHRLRGDFDQIFRSRHRRTKHAQVRHEGGERPTRTVWNDARSFPIERVLYDVQHDTFIVLGKRGRAHVFAADGRHVTSLRLAPDEVEKKTRRGRWQSVDEEQYRRVQTALAAQVSLWDGEM